MRLSRFQGHEKCVPHNLHLWVQHFSVFTTFPSLKVFPIQQGSRKKTTPINTWNDMNISTQTPPFWCHQGESWPVTAIGDTKSALHAVTTPHSNVELPCSYKRQPLSATARKPMTRKPRVCPLRQQWVLTALSFYQTHPLTCCLKATLLRVALPWGWKASGTGVQQNRNVVLCGVIFCGIFSMFPNVGAHAWSQKKFSHAPDWHLIMLG